MDPGQAKGGKRTSTDTIDDSSRKKPKMVDDSGAKLNPYLAHMYQDDGAAAANGYGPFAGMRRRQTTAEQAEKAEDSDSNPFTGNPHTQQYFRILETRRNLPVHKQRWVTRTRRRSEGIDSG